jgi:hypothetical protein
MNNPNPLIGNYFEDGRELHRAKVDVLRKVAGGRCATAALPMAEVKGQFFEGLNEAFVVFNDSKEVIDALMRFNDAASSPEKPLVNDRLADVFRAMAHEVRLPVDNSADRLFLRPFCL